MAGLSTQLEVDTAFLEKLTHLPDELTKAARRALVKVNRWLRSVTMIDLGYELSIDSKAIHTRFRSYKKSDKSKLWVGIRGVGVHRIGQPQQVKGGVNVGNYYFDKAFISPMNSGELLVWRRTGKQRDSLERVDLDIADEAEEILGSYLNEINNKFEEHFHSEFQYILSGA